MEDEDQYRVSLEDAIALDTDEEGNEPSPLKQTKRRNVNYVSEMENRKLIAPGHIRLQAKEVCEHFLQPVASGRSTLTDEDIKIVQPRPISVHVSLCSTDSQESSEENAQNFVDHFLSVNNLDLFENTGSRRINRTESPPTLSAKGAQTLAKSVNLGNKARQLGIFDWPEKQTSESNLVKDLREQFDVESLEQPLGNDDSGSTTPELFDVGFDTQIAAEAMEALLYAPPPHCNAKYTPQVPAIQVHNSSEGAPTSMELEVCAHLDTVGSNSQTTARQSENMKSSVNGLYGYISCSFQEHSRNQIEYNSASPAKKNIICMGPLTANTSSRGRPVSMKKNENGRYSRVFHQQKKDGILEHNLREAGVDLCSSKSVKCKRDDLKKFSQATKRTKYQSMSSSEKSKDLTCSFKRRKRSKLKFEVLQKTEKRGNIDMEGQKMFGVSGKCFKLGSVASKEVTRAKRTQQGNVTSALVGSGSLLKLDPWNHPKGKRTAKTMVYLSNGSSRSYALRKDKCPIKNSKTVKGMAGPLAPKRVEFQSFIERVSSMSMTYLKTDEKSLPGFCNTESAITIEQTVPLELDGENSLNQSAKLDVKSSISSVDYAKNIKLNAASDGHKTSETSNSDYQSKKPGKRILSRLSLTRELTRLGYEKSLPDFMPRESRRHNSANICVLFSQHLESTVINQQKKIMARLGFSVASCCSDATHFVTDRFVRTRNMLEAIAFGKPVVTHLWLESCGQANCYIDEKKYILRDAKKEKEIGFSMPVSLACASQHPLLKGRRVFVTPNVKPGKELIQSLVRAAKGKAVQSIQKGGKNDGIPNDILILSTEEDYTTCAPFLEKGAAVYDSELLLNGIIIQKLEYERHQLFTNCVGSNCPRTRSRKN